MANKKRKIEPAVDYEPILIKRLKDPQEAAEFLNAALEEFQEDEDIASFNIALDYLLKAKNISQISKTTGISRQHIYRILSGESQTNFANIASILSTIGFKLYVKPIEE